MSDLTPQDPHAAAAATALAVAAAELRNADDALVAHGRRVLTMRVTNVRLRRSIPVGDEKSRELCQKVADAEAKMRDAERVYRELFEPADPDDPDVLAFVNAKRAELGLGEPVEALPGGAPSGYQCPVARALGVGEGGPVRYVARTYISYGDGGVEELPPAVIEWIAQHDRRAQR